MTSPRIILDNEYGRLYQLEVMLLEYLDKVILSEFQIHPSSMVLIGQSYSFRARLRSIPRTTTTTKTLTNQPINQQQLKTKLMTLLIFPRLTHYCSSYRRRLCY